VFGDDGTTVVGLFGISRDITERKRMESELSDAKKLSDDIINGLPGIFYMINTEGNLFRWNTHFSTVTGYSDAEMINRPALDIIATEDKALVATRIEEVFKTGESFVEAGLLHKNGEITPYYFTGLRTTLQDQTYIVGLGQDIADRKRMEQQLWQLANTDFLTGLMNRRYFMDKMQEEFLRVRYHEVPYSCVLMLDLDHFKRINDTYNHAVGDTVLRHFAALMQSSLRQKDIAGRLGGEEFAVMLPCTDIIEAQKCAERLRQLTMDNPIVQNNQRIPITVSIGIAMLKENDTCVDAALVRADNALYCAKKSGRNRIQIIAEC
jgi:diguanylate cyclase (GGDEF)-like protein/PAS domain S-box-containing protein